MKRKWMWVSSAAVVVLLAALVVLAVLFWPKNSPNPIDAPKDEPEDISFQARIIDCYENSVMVAPTEDGLCDRITFSTAQLEDIGADVGDLVEIYYSGEMMESYPAQIIPIKWRMIEDAPEGTYIGQWLNKETVSYIGTASVYLEITEIGSSYFLGDGLYEAVTYRINGLQSPDWCVGDQVQCQLDNVFQDESGRVEGDLVSILPYSDLPAPEKPVIYLYPQERMDVSVKLDFDGQLSCTYPAYGNGWQVTAQPDGTLTDANGKIYNYLYWEGVTPTQYDLSNGFCVAGKDTALFLEWALEQLGLNRREANEFIVYWLPMMEDNPYNIISFQTDIYTESAELSIEPAPDTLIRVFMAWKASDSFVELEEQTLSAPNRTGFTVVEWGGAKIK